MARLGEDRRVAQESEPDANEAPAEAGAVPRPQSGQRCSLHMGRRAWLGPVRGPEPIPSPQSDPRPNQTFSAPKVGLPTARNSSGSSQGLRAPSLCGEVPPNSTTPQAKDRTQRPSSWAWGIPWGPCRAKEPGPGQLTQQILSWKVACLVPRTQPRSSSPVCLLLGGLQEALGLGRTRLENRELRAVIRAAVYARRAQQTFTTLPPAGGLTPPPHPSRTRELGGGGWGTRLEQSPGETGQGATEGGRRAAGAGLASPGGKNEASGG